MKLSIRNRSIEKKENVYTSVCVSVSMPLLSEQEKEKSTKEKHTISMEIFGVVFCVHQ